MKQRKLSLRHIRIVWNLEVRWARSINEYDYSYDIEVPSLDISTQASMYEGYMVPQDRRHGKGLRHHHHSRILYNRPSERDFIYDCPF